jgi:metal-responsive CopG/Arc/MetJ family transcriptional regulator
MAVKQNVKQKRRGGRPATGHDPVIALRMPPALTARVDEWAKQQPDQPSRSEAIRRMIEMTLKIKEKRRNEP